MQTISLKKIIPFLFALRAGWASTHHPHHGLTGYRVDILYINEYKHSIHALHFSSVLPQYEESRLGSHLPPVEDASVVAKLIVSQRKLNVGRGGVPYVQSFECGRRCCDPMQSNGVNLFNTSNAPPTSTVPM